ncbi:nitrous oxide reductase family maturation protein NosD [Sphingobacterium sp. DK4209]|uniref:Nitrous oxide reductase family maturation protein NosD n=1 Tax=Sphingobacterium zhuxiongii TaxID=2662364 RepID=A0A5Q0QBX7_9SPHI|nr:MULTISPECIES: nitrous oxide reductase family maturation protein NosD [unclassified Sphingobacterium]MVZ64658.1 nitrous oxide reductase family maturation protein NosD [Sphingobacterium sp. DK4209]QGA26996.1 nitrous oxide reductase family maturation protein NosD [Sphingobacterium sp. dk4302]
MKKLTLNIFSTMFVYFMVAGCAQAATIEIGPGKHAKTIKAGIAAAKAGDTVLVHAGVYREGNIIIDKPLTLLGEGNPTLDGQKKFEPLSIKSHAVVIQGFTVKGSGHSSLDDIAGIKIYNTYDVKVLDNILDDNFFGVYSQNCRRLEIRGNKIRAYGKAEQLIGNGIHAWKSDSLTIVGNEIVGHRDGIYLEFVTHTHALKNLSQNNLRYGLHFMFSHDNSYVENTFRSNGAGVAVMYTKNVHMENNKFEENWGDAAYGLLLKDISDSQIINNQFDRNTTGIFMEGSNRIHLEKNNFKDNGWAIKVQASCMDNRFKDNNFLQNTFDVATNGSLSLNYFEQNYWDKYEGYDLDNDGIGDIPFRPVSLFSMLVERYPSAMLLFRSFMVALFDRTEKLLPSLTPEGLKDEKPRMKSMKV